MRGRESREAIQLPPLSSPRCGPPAGWLQRQRLRLPGTCTPQEEGILRQSRPEGRLPARTCPQLSLGIDGHQPVIHRPLRRPLREQRGFRGPGAEWHRSPRAHRRRASTGSLLDRRPGHTTSDLAVMRIFRRTVPWHRRLGFARRAPRPGMSWVYRPALGNQNRPREGLRSSFGRRTR